MRKFLDKHEHAWEIDLTFGAVSRVKTLSDGRYDLLKPEKPIEHPEFDTPQPLQTVLMLDLPSLWEVLYMLVEPAATEKNITALQFADRLTPEKLLIARDVFRQEWRDFFRHLQRPDQADALEKIGEWIKEGQRQLAEAMDNNPLLKQLDEKVKTEMNLSLKNSFGKLEASLGSTPDRSLGVNST